MTVAKHPKPLWLLAIGSFVMASACSAPDNGNAPVESPPIEELAYTGFVGLEEFVQLDIQVGGRYVMYSKSVSTRGAMRSEPRGDEVSFGVVSVAAGYFSVSELSRGTPTEEKSHFQVERTSDRIRWPITWKAIGPEDQRFVELDRVHFTYSRAATR